MISAFNMNLKNVIVLTGAAGVLLLWFGLHFGWLADDPDILIRLVLGVLFAVLILLRQKRTVSSAVAVDEPTATAEGEAPTPIPAVKAPASLPAWLLAVMAVAGLVLALAGIIFGVRQFEWIGLLLILCACLQWGLPPSYRPDIFLALFFIYWVPPLPNQLFGPFQLAMQQWSVAGSEWLLQCVNVRVWADGMVLCTGSHLFGVPEACSGMRTAVTVLICSMGIGVLLRFRWYWLVVVVVSGVFQVLLLNIVRICLMVYLAPKMPDAWASTFLHDSAGILLIGAIFLIQLEAALGHVLLLRRQERLRLAVIENRVDQYDAGFYLPLGRLVHEHGWLAWVVPLVVLFAIVAAAAAYKNRPYHKAMMIRDVIEVMVLADPSHAEKASLVACELVPNDTELRTERIKVLLLCEKFDVALAELGKIPVKRRKTVHTILEAWCVMGLGRIKDAIALVDSLPAEERSFPGVALVRAEFAAVSDDTKGVVDNITKAAVSPWTIRRVRELFPYLALRHQWETIAACDMPGVPYNDPTHVVIVLHAFMQTNARMEMARTLKYGMDRWPTDQRFLQYLAVIATDTPGSRWEDLFAKTVKATIEKLSVDDLAVYIEDSFRISRPDLAWLMYNRLRAIDPRDPALKLLAAQFGDVWFTFRKRHVGISAAGQYDTIDLKSYYFTHRKWPVAPLVDKIGSRVTIPMRAEYLRTCLEELERRDKSGKLSLRMRMMYPVALKLAGKYEEAEKQQQAALQAAEKDKELASAVAAIQAQMKTMDMHDAGELLKPAMKKWPHAPQLLECLAALAKEDADNDWEAQFAAKLESAPDTLGVDELAVFIDGAFLINRPDLAWEACNRLQAIDPKDPALLLSRVQFDAQWFLFRCSLAGLPAKTSAETEDLRVLYLVSRDWASAPLAQEMSVAQSVTGRRQYLEACLEEIQRREKAGALSPRMRMMYPTTLGLLGRYAEAHASLDAIAVTYPDQKRALLFKHALFYHMERKWEETYESTRAYLLTGTQPNIKIALMQTDALMNLGLGAYALDCVNAAAKTFQGAPEVIKARAAIWATFSAPEEALFELQHLDDYRSLPIIPRLLQDTERYNESKYLSSAQMHESSKHEGDTRRQAMLLPQAEMTVTPQWEAPLDAKGMESESLRFASSAEEGVSSFVGGLDRLKAEWYSKQGEGDVSQPDRWIAVGRDASEQGVALTELVMLLGRQKRYEEAINIAEQALQMLPESVALWRAILGLGRNKLEVVEAARRGCPSDPEIWLAYLVIKARDKTPGDWALDEVESAVKDNRFSAGTMTRAGDFLRRQEMLAAAMKCSRYAVKNGEGLLPAYVLGLRCGLAAGDQQWTLLCAREAAAVALDPLPFYKLEVEMEWAAGLTGQDTVIMLEKLIAACPDEHRWATRLGDIYLRRGDGHNAMRVLDALMASRPENIDLDMLLLTAEAARRTGKSEKSIEILEKAYVAYPANRVVLNNLVYALAFDKKTLPRARQLLPKLLSTWGDSFAALDTAAVVYFNSGQPVEARACLQKALNAVRDVDPLWFERNPTAVDVDAYLGEYDRSLNKGLSADELALRSTWRAELLPLARGLVKKAKGSAKDR